MALGSLNWLAILGATCKDRRLFAAFRSSPRLATLAPLAALWLSSAALAADGDPSAARRWFGGPEVPTALGEAALTEAMSAAACGHCHREIAEQWCGS